jgi:chromosome segregation ATPase
LRKHRGGIFKMDRLDAKTPNDFMSMLQEIASRGPQNFSGTMQQPVAVGGISPAQYTEMLGVVSRAQLQNKQLELEMAAMNNELKARDARLDSITEELRTVNSAFVEYKNEVIPVLTQHSQLESELAIAKEELAKTKKKDDDSDADAENDNDADDKTDKKSKKKEKMKAKKLARKQEMEELKAEVARLKAAAETAGAEEVGAQDTARGDANATTETLSAEEAAEKIAQTEKSEDEKLLDEYARLEALAYGATASGREVQAFAAFVKEHGAELGIPTV